MIDRRPTARCPIKRTAVAPIRMPRWRKSRARPGSSNTKCIRRSTPTAASFSIPKSPPAVGTTISRILSNCGASRDRYQLHDPRSDCGPWIWLRRDHQGPEGTGNQAVHPAVESTQRQQFGTAVGIDLRAGAGSHSLSRREIPLSQSGELREPQTICLSASGLPSAVPSLRHVRPRPDRSHRTRDSCFARWTRTSSTKSRPK